MRISKHLAALACVVACAAPAAADEVKLAELDAKQLEALSDVQIRIETVNDLERRGRLGATVAAEERARHLQSVAEVTSVALTLEDLAALRAAPRRSWTGYLTFMNLLWVVVGLLLVIALGWLTALYVVPLLAELPKPVLEALLYAACAGLIVAPASVITGGGVLALAVVGCLGLLPLVAWTHALHFDRRNKDTNMVRIYAVLLGVAWGAAAVFHGSSLIATGSVIAFAVLTGTLVLPLIDVALHHEKTKVPAVTLAALLLLLVFGGLTITGQRVPAIGEALVIFTPGSLWVGTTVFFAGLMTLSSWNYHDQEAGLGFWVGNGLALGGAVLGLWVGSVWGIDVIREGSGSFVAFYLLFKLLELPWKKEGWAWAALLTAGMLYGFAAFAERYPQYFLGF